MKEQSSKRIAREKRTVERMVRLYCRKNEGHDFLCPACEELLVYAHKRLSVCPFGDNKPTCKRCPIHCYKPDMRERMRAVMRYAGSRMLFYHPLDAIVHFTYYFTFPLEVTWSCQRAFSIRRT